jgi:hypothetical protein
VTLSTNYTHRKNSYTELLLYLIYDQVYIYIYNRHVWRLQELISLAENRKLGEWMNDSYLTCELCFIQSYFHGRWKKSEEDKKIWFLWGSHSKMRTQFAVWYLESELFFPQFCYLHTRFLNSERVNWECNGVRECNGGCYK